MDLLRLLLGELLLGALNREHIALDENFHGLGLHPGDLGDDPDMLRLLEDVHDRRPGGRRDIAELPLVVRRHERLVE